MSGKMIRDDFGTLKPPVQALLSTAQELSTAPHLTPGAGPFLAGNIYYAAGDVERAIGAFEAAASSTGAYRTAAFDRLDGIFQDKGRPDDAVRFYRKRVEADGKNPGYKAKLAYALMRCGQDSEAKQYLRKVEPAAADACARQLRTV